MKNNRVTVWLIGSNASGKTTQARLLHQLQINTKPIYRESYMGNLKENPERLCYTEFEEKLVCNIGWVKNNQCTGTDSLHTRLQVEHSYKKAIQSWNKIIIVDGIMATGQWLNFLRNEDTKLLVVLLHFVELEDNILRIQQRRQAKHGGELPSLDDRTIKNITGKIKGFKSMFDKASEVADKSLLLNAVQPENIIHGYICDSIFNLIDNA